MKKPPPGALSDSPTERSRDDRPVSSTHRRPTMQSFDTMESYRRVRRDGRFADRFYERLLASHPRMPTYFAKTDFRRQKQLLEHGVQMLLEYARGNAIGRMAVERLGRSHGRDHMNVLPSLYPLWIECLLQALSELDPEWNASLAREWHREIGEGVALMQSMYEPSIR